MKTPKERISMWFNDEFKHEGCLWQGRFYSGVVEKDAVVKVVRPRCVHCAYRGLSHAVGFTLTYRF